MYCMCKEDHGVRADAFLCILLQSVVKQQYFHPQQAMSLSSVKS